MSLRALVASRTARARVLWLVLSSTCGACTDRTTELLPQRTPLGGAGQPGRGGPGVSAPTLDPTATRCGNHICACDDGLDQDDDLLVDGLDSECTGPYDDDEASFGTGTGGGSLPACQSCFWHGGPAGGGNDDSCRRPLDCAFDAQPPAPLIASCGSCEVADACRASCLPSTPNGCDCFGCCEAIGSDGPVHVLLAGTCSLGNVDDEAKCPRCTPSPDCHNPCGTCELCGSKKRKDLARECRGMPSDLEPTNTCDEGERICDAQSPCPETHYCQLGCCRVIRS